MDLLKCIWLAFLSLSAGQWSICRYQQSLMLLSRFYSLLLLKNYLFIFNWLMIGLISVIHQHELTIGVHMSPPSWISLPAPTHSHSSRLLQNKPYWGFPCGSDGEESPCNVGDLGSIPGSGRSPGEGNGNPLQCSCLENPMDRGGWWATVNGVTNSWAGLSM